MQIMNRITHKGRELRRCMLASGGKMQWALCHWVWEIGKDLTQMISQTEWSLLTITPPHCYKTCQKPFRHWRGRITLDFLV